MKHHPGCWTLGDGKPVKPSAPAAAAPAAPPTAASPPAPSPAEFRQIVAYLDSIALDIVREAA